MPESYPGTHVRFSLLLVHQKLPDINEEDETASREASSSHNSAAETGGSGASSGGERGPVIGKDEVLRFPTNCPNCNAPAETNMKLVGE